MTADDTLKQRYIGEVKRVAFHVAPWVPADAEVDLSFACMFGHEMPGTALSGGLLHLDQLLGGALTDLRREGAFRAQEMETILLKSLPVAVRAASIMVIGLGEPEILSPQLLERALRIAAREAVRPGVKTVAFASDLLDAGLTQESTLHSASAMLKGVIEALEAER